MHAGFRALLCTQFSGDCSYTDGWFITFSLFLIIAVAAGLSWSILIEVKIKFNLE